MAANELAERPIGVFESIIRVVCKAAAWDGLRWFEAQDIPQINTIRGRRIGAARLAGRGAKGDYPPT